MYDRGETQYNNRGQAWEAQRIQGSPAVTTHGR